MKINRTVYKYKVGLVVKSFKQKQGCHIFDTYLPVTRITYIRKLIVSVVLYDLQIHQIYVKTTLLNGELEEEFYFEQPEGFEVPGQQQKVCDVVK